MSRRIAERYVSERSDAPILPTCCSPASFARWARAMAVTGLVVCGAVLSMPEGSAAGPTLEDRLFFRVESSYREKKFAEAAQDVQRVIKLNPRHAGARYYQGLLFEQADRKADAARIYQSLLNDQQFGGMAKDRLFALKQEKRTDGQNRSIQSYIDGGGFAEALRECKKALNEGRRDEPLLVQTIVSAALSGDLRYAEAALTEMKKTGQPIAELRTFLDGWTVRLSSPRDAVERLLALSDQRLLVWHVRQEIRRLLKDLQLYDDYEKYLKAEKKRPGVDINAVDAELIRLYIDQGLYDKAMNSLQSRPLESLTDNLLYLELLTLTAREPEAMKVARNLLQMRPDEESLHEWWMRAFLHYHERMGMAPTGTDDGGLKLQDIAQQEVERVLKGPAEGEESRRLFYAAQLAAVIGQETFLKGLVERIQKAPMTEELAPVAQATSRVLEDRGYRHYAIKIMESALAQRPDDMDMQFALAEEYFLENRSSEAVKLLEDVTGRDATRVRAYLLLIDALAACGRVDEAHQRALDRMDDLSIPDLIRGQIRSRAILLADKLSPERKASFGGPASAPAPATPDAGSSAATESVPAWPTPAPAAPPDAASQTTEPTDQESENR